MISITLEDMEITTYYDDERIAPDLLRLGRMKF